MTPSSSEKILPKNRRSIIKVSLRLVIGSFFVTLLVIACVIPPTELLKRATMTLDPLAENLGMSLAELTKINLQQELNKGEYGFFSVMNWTNQRQMMPMDSPLNRSQFFTQFVKSSLVSFFGGN